MKENFKEEKEVDFRQMEEWKNLEKFAAIIMSSRSSTSSAGKFPRQNNYEDGSSGVVTSLRKRWNVPVKSKNKNFKRLRNLDRKKILEKVNSIDFQEENDLPRTTTRKKFVSIRMSNEDHLIGEPPPQEVLIDKKKEEKKKKNVDYLKKAMSSMTIYTLFGFCISFFCVRKSNEIDYSGIIMLTKGLL